MSARPSDSGGCFWYVLVNGGTVIFIILGIIGMFSLAEYFGDMGIKDPYGMVFCNIPFFLFVLYVVYIKLLKQ